MSANNGSQRFCTLTHPVTLQVSSHLLPQPDHEDLEYSDKFVTIARQINDGLILGNPDISVTEEGQDRGAIYAFRLLSDWEKDALKQYFDSGAPPMPHWSTVPYHPEDAESYSASVLVMTKIWGEFPFTNGHAAWLRFQGPEDVCDLVVAIQKIQNSQRLFEECKFLLAEQLALERFLNSADVYYRAIEPDLTAYLNGSSSSEIEERRALILARFNEGFESVRDRIEELDQLIHPLS
ncbi:hypothetical protein N7452_007114 [Penicillium brevicompactum]|uniref:Uncharacterized protein n=1 Tax=Penicillium brevicompactum TaxID=5074 RepID=A0A9W9QH91_PENBR|nr:hypothetical protein N7452_007114 [Penicillium brevicompactum]